jgi:hypothetical protein
MITHAIFCYGSVMNEFPLPMRVFNLFLAPSDFVWRKEHAFHQIACQMEGWSETERARVCMQLIAPAADGNDDERE